MTDYPKKANDLRRAELLGRLPESIRALPSIQYRRREASNATEYLSDVEYGVQGPKDLKSRLTTSLSKRPRG